MSDERISITKELKALSERLGLVLLDHLVIGAKWDDGFTSLAELNMPTRSSSSSGRSCNCPLC